MSEWKEESARGCDIGKSAPAQNTAAFSLSFTQIRSEFPKASKAICRYVAQAQYLFDTFDSALTSAKLDKYGSDVHIILPAWNL